MGTKTATGTQDAAGGVPVGDAFAARLKKLEGWRNELAAAITAYQEWVEEQGLTEGTEDLRIYELIESIKSDKLTLALVAEFSRGKSELLNAIFFADFKQRLLPSSAGRTTMCPTELRYDEKEQPGIKLLPIESRKTMVSINEYKRTPVHWTSIHILKTDSAEEVKAAFAEVTRTKNVSIQDAQELGLYDPSHSRRTSDLKAEDGFVAIPMWRHAIINFPHPLLRQGLVILDTPGLNALGAEPELTMSALPSAQAILYVLAADVGVTRSDHEVWAQHIQATRGVKTLVALNKIDTMWDDLRDAADIQNQITQQVDETARTLKIDHSMIFPVSAQKGLAGKIKGDVALLDKSGLLALEKKLADDMIPARHSMIRDRVVQEVSARVHTSLALLDSRLAEVNQQISELKQLGTRNLDTIQRMVAHVRTEKQKYDHEVEGFNLTRAAMTTQAQTVLGILSIKSFDELMNATRNEMQDSWTTRGMQSGMQTLFAGAAERVQKVGAQSKEIHAAVQQIYQRLHKEFGLPEIHPPPLSLVSFLVEFKKLEEKAETFRSSPMMVMTEQNLVIKKFFISLAASVRQLFDECSNTTKNWFKTAVSPVFLQVQQHKAAIERHLEMLRKVHQNMDSVGERIAEMETERKRLETSRAIGAKLLERIQTPLY